MKLRIGTAAWTLPKAVQRAFPGEGTHLQRYARVFRGVEINSSFYRSHSPHTYANWAAAVPKDFRFAVKLPQSITHEMRLRRARRPLEQFLVEVAGLGMKLGPLLIQLPPSFSYEPRAVRGFLALLRDRSEGPVVCEPRHASWFTDRAEKILVEYRVARVAADPATVPAAAAPAGWPGIAYYRLHGSPDRYWSVYSAAQIRKLAGTLRALARTRETWCIFDNTASGGAAKNALQLLRL